MTSHVRHFVLTGDGRIREFSAEQAARVAGGASPMPEFADACVRYLQLTLDDEEGAGGTRAVAALSASAADESALARLEPLVTRAAAAASVRR